MPFVATKEHSAKLPKKSFDKLGKDTIEKKLLKWINEILDGWIDNKYNLQQPE